MSFERALTERLRYLEEHDPHKDEGYWYPSQMFFCDRSAVLQHAGVEEKPEDDLSLRRMWLGRKIHEAIQEVHPFKVIGHEVRCRNADYKVSGRLDTLSLNAENVLEVQEYKSINSRSFSYQDLPKENDIAQVGVYLLFGCECPNNDKNFLFDCPICTAPSGHGRLMPQQGRLIYISKDDLRIEEFIITMTPELELKIRSKLVELESAYKWYLKTKELPDVLPLQKKKIRGKEVLVRAWQGKYCGFRGSGQCCADQPTTNAEEENETE